MTIRLAYCLCFMYVGHNRSYELGPVSFYTVLGQGEPIVDGHVQPLLPFREPCSFRRSRRDVRNIHSSLTERCIALYGDPGLPGLRTKAEWVVSHRARSFAQHRMLTLFHTRTNVGDPAGILGRSSGRLGVVSASTGCTFS